MLRSRRTVLSLLAIALATVLGAAAAIVVWPWVRGSAAPAPTLVFAEFGQHVDRVYTAPANDPARRIEVVAIEHAPGWGLNAGPQLVRGLVAYTILPPQARGEAATPAELWVLEVPTRNRRLLASDADLRVPPVLSADGAALLYRSSAAGGRQSIGRVDITAGTRKVLHSIETTFGVFPLGVAAGGDAIFASLSAQGTDIYRLAEGRPPVLLIHASDQVARDWRLSPDGRLLAYLAPEVEAERVVHRLHLIDLANGAERPRLALPPTTPVDLLSPVWTADGSALTVGRDPAGEPRAGMTTLPADGTSPRPLPAPERGFDVPMAWSPDGAYLVARGFTGTSVAQPGTESAVVVSGNGGRYVVGGVGEIIVLGWLPGTAR